MRLLRIATMTFLLFMIFMVCLVNLGCSQPVTSEKGELLPELPEELHGTVIFHGTADGRWVRPGDDPFTGDVASALTAQGMPARTQAKLIPRMAAKQYDDIVCADRSSVIARTSHVVYYPGMAMTFGTSEIRYNMTPNFIGVQCGLLYIEDGFHEWVPYVCGNYTRLMPFYEASAYARSQRPNVLPGIGNSWLSSVFYRRGGISDRRGQPYQPMPDLESVHVVPEPPVWALLILGGLYVGYRSRR